MAGFEPRHYQIVAANVNGDPCDTYFNIFAVPLFVNPASGNYHYVVGASCIDAGDPNSPFDPDSTVPDIGAFYYYQTPQIVPQTIDDLTIAQLGNGAVLSWSPVLNDILGNPIEVSLYMVYISPTDPFFIPTSLDSIGAVTPPDTTFMDIDALGDPMRFYNVKAEVEN